MATNLCNLPVSSHKSKTLTNFTSKITLRHSLSCTTVVSRTEVKKRITTSASHYTKSPIGVHSQVWVGGWSKEQCELAIGKSASLGYDLIEISVGQPEIVDVELTKGILANYGLAASTSLGLTLDADISSADDEINSSGEKLLLDALNVAGGIGAKYLTGVTHSAIAKYPGPFPGGKAKENLLSSIRKVASRAEDVGVIFGLEIVNRYESNVLNTAAQGVELIKEVDHPNVVLHLDSYHMNIEEGNLALAVEACGSYLGYVHIGESHRGYLGTGTIDWNQLFRALAKIDYQGPITFESFSSEVVSDSLSNTLCVWRNLWSDSEDLAKHAKGFIDSHWQAAQKAI